MALIELLETKIINFSDLRTVERRSDSPTAEQYHRLQETNFYDSAQHEWVWSLREHEPNKDTIRFGYDQLLGIYVEKLIYGTEYASKHYEEIKNRYYNKKKKLWYKYPKQDTMNSLPIKNQLINISLVKEFNGNKPAADLYDSVKDKYFNSESNEWYSSPIVSVVNPYATSCESIDYLLDILVTSKIFDKESVIKKYNAAKNRFCVDEQFMNNSAQLWLNNLENESIIDGHFYTGDQLMALIVEAELFGKESIRSKYEIIKSKFFDENTGLWLISRNRDDKPLNDFITPDQLLGIWLDKLLEPEGTLLLTKDKPIPEIRKF